MNNNGKYGATWVSSFRERLIEWRCTNRNGPGYNPVCHRRLCSSWKQGSCAWDMQSTYLTLSVLKNTCICVHKTLGALRGWGGLFLVMWLWTISSFQIFSQLDYWIVYIIYPPPPLKKVAQIQPGQCYRCVLYRFLFSKGCGKNIRMARLSQGSGRRKLGTYGQDFQVCTC